MALVKARASLSVSLEVALCPSREEGQFDLNTAEKGKGVFRVHTKGVFAFPHFHKEYSFELSRKLGRGASGITAQQNLRRCLNIQAPRIPRLFGNAAVLCSICNQMSGGKSL